MISIPFLLAVTVAAHLLDLPYAWVPTAGLACEVIYRPFDSWVQSDRIGESAVASAFMRMVLSAAGAAGSASFWASFCLCGYWLWIR